MPGLSKGKGEPAHKNEKSQSATSHRPWLFPCSQDTAYDSHAGHASFAIPCASHNPHAARKPHATHGSYAYPQPRALPAVARAPRNPHAVRKPRTCPVAPHTLQHRKQLLVGRVVERVNQIAHLRKLAFQLVEPRLNPIFLRTREHAQASELLA